jgi:hypothetical protein
MAAINESGDPVNDSVLLGAAGVMIGAVWGGFAVTSTLRAAATALENEPLHADVDQHKPQRDRARRIARQFATCAMIATAIAVAGLWAGSDLIGDAAKFDTSRDPSLPRLIYMIVCVVWAAIAIRLWWRFASLARHSWLR